MFVHNNGAIAAALISAGLHDLPMDFNLDDGIVQKYMDEFAISHPAFDKVAHQALAIVKAAEGYAATLKHIEEELASKKEEPKAEEPVPPAPSAPPVEPPSEPPATPPDSGDGQHS